MSEEKEYIPFHDLPTEGVMLRSGVCTTIPSGAMIAVLKHEDDDGISIRISKPLEDGKKSLLSFGLSRDAAIALIGLLEVQID
jgi:hypothetical protein